jgi:hypothetical protein
MLLAFLPAVTLALATLSAAPIGDIEGVGLHCAFAFLRQCFMSVLGLESKQ